VTDVKVLHVIEHLTIGGAQRSAMTLARTKGHDARIVPPSDIARRHLAWADVIVAHVWRSTKGDPYVPVPVAPGLDSKRLIVFNHDVEGRIDQPCSLVLVYSEAALRRQDVNARVQVIPGGIGLAGLQRVAGSRVWGEIGSLGRLSTLHDGKIAPRTIDWWSSLPVRRLVVGGSGSQLDALRSAFATTRIEFPGEIRPRDRHNLLAQLDLFCYQTEWHEESFGYVVLEALAAGCVVVTEPRGALTELVVDNMNGVVVDGYDAAAEQLRSLIADPARCARLSAAGVRTASQYSSHAMQSRFGAVVADFLSTGGAT
jgi:glycosyltransferase involved in cell wall biosynthesis